MRMYYSRIPTRGFWHWLLLKLTGNLPHIKREKHSNLKRKNTKKARRMKKEHIIAQKSITK